MSDSEYDSDIENASEAAMISLVPQKSRKLYEETFKKFDCWCKEKKVGTISEKVVLAYFSKLSSVYKPSTLWSVYSMLRTMIYLNKKVNIKSYNNVFAFIKRKSSGYKPKKSRIYSKQEIQRFIDEAGDEDYLLAKVVLIIGIYGACRREELTFLRLEDIEDSLNFIKISIPNTKTNISRVFTITEGSMNGINFLDIFRKYAQLRPSHTPHQRFFLTYRKGKCCTLPVGINTIGAIPRKIAEFLGLDLPKEYTGHCFRRSSATLLADSGADMTVIKRHGGWRSSSVAEGYVESSLENKKEISKKILGQKETSIKKVGLIDDEQSENTSDNLENYGPEMMHIEVNREEKIEINSNSNNEIPNVRISNLNKCTVNIYNK